MIHKAKDLSPDQKQLVASLVGRRVLDIRGISFDPAAADPLLPREDAAR